MYLTKRQKEVFDYLEDYIVLNGYAPTFEEIAGHFGFSSKGTVYKYVKTLRQKGLIGHEWNRVRSIQIRSALAGGQRVLPVLGFVSAGKPIQAVKNVERLEVPRSFVGRGNHFILRVTGDSMIGEQIIDGDYVVVREEERADNGETVVALLDSEEVTIKKFFVRNGSVELRPAHAGMDSLVLEASRVRIQGVVVGVLRKY